MAPLRRGSSEAGCTSSLYYSGVVPPPSSEVRVGEPVPTPVPYARAFGLAHPRRGAVEIRFPVRPEDARPDGLYVRELGLLTALDHPVFPPVLDFGQVEGRTGYTVPATRGRPLTEVAVDPDFPDAARVHAVLQLAGALAAAHRAGAALGGLRADQILWDDAIPGPRIPFPLAPTLGGDPGLPLPPDVDQRAAAGRDVASWGVLAYWLLGGSTQVFDPDGTVQPLAGPLSGADWSLAYVVESSLGADPNVRPENGLELLRLLDGISEEVDLEESLDNLQLRGYSAETREVRMAEVREDLAAVAVAEDPGAPLDAAQLQDLAEAFAEGVQQLGSGPGQGRLLAGALALGLAVLAVVAWSSTPSTSGEWSTSEAPGSARLEVSAATLEDPQVRALLAVRPVTPGEFPTTWYRVRNLIAAGRLPAGLATARALRDLKAAFNDDPQAACAQMDRLLERIEGGDRSDGEAPF